MRWEDERYVRLYTRDTPEEVALGWEACALWREMLRKFDRAGILDLGKTGMRGLAALTRIPVEVVERNLPLLLEDGRVRLVGAVLVCPNYIAANETPSSGSLRTREWRARQRELAAASALFSPDATPGDDASQTGDEPSQFDDEMRRGVTRCDSVPCRAVPCRANPEDPASAGSEPPGSGHPPRAEPDAPPPEAPSPRSKPTDPQPQAGQAVLLPLDAPTHGPSPAERVFAAYLSGWRHVIHGTRPPRLDDRRRRLIAARLRDFPAEELEQAAAGIWRSSWHVEQKQTSFDLTMRDSAHVERFRDIALRGDAPRINSATTASRSTLQQPAPEGQGWETGPRAPSEF